MRAYKYYSEITEEGVITLPKLPFKKGEKVEVIVIPQDEFPDLLKASESSLSFWDNPIDDKVWNNA